VAGGTEFNRGKFKELVVYLSEVAEREGDEGFGMVKLNKLLYRADFEAYRLLGRSITGETYEKQEFGPVARNLLIALDELAASGRLYWQQVPRGPHTSKVPTIPKDESTGADTSQFSETEREIIDHTLQELATYGGKSVSTWSHRQSAGWNMVPQIGQEIEYSTAFTRTEPIPAEEIERAKQYARDKGWTREAS
jgi:hypothetical protein